MRPTLVMAVALALAAPAALAQLPDDPVPGAPEGLLVTPVVALAVPTAIEFGPGGADGPDLYATLLSGDVVRVDLAWTDADVPVALGVDVVASGFSTPLGLAFHGNDLIVADSHAGAESGRTDGRLTLVREDGTSVVIVDGLPNGRHATNHLRFGPDGRLYVANGNPNDSGLAGGDPDVHPYSGAILSVDVDEVSASPAVLRWVDSNGDRIPEDAIPAHAVNADFAGKVDVLAWGFRNVFGVAFHPDLGIAYTATNGADVPSSQDAFYRITPGTDYGFPFCYNDGFPGAVGSDVTKRTNPVYDGHDCSTTPPADALLGWHVCATGIDFPTEGTWAFPDGLRNSAFVGECGPFFADDLVTQTVAQGGERAERNTGHKVTRVALDENGHATEVSDFLDGLALPTDVRFGPHGAMYVADAEGVLRVAPVVPGGSLP